MRYDSYKTRREEKELRKRTMSQKEREGIARITCMDLLEDQGLKYCKIPTTHNRDAEGWFDANGVEGVD